MKRLLIPMLAIVILSACQPAPNSPSTDTPYTRGIGVYPGDPAEYTGPELVPGGPEIRNLALRRPVRTSSNYDFNLTGQLVTDGSISRQMPCYLEVTTHDGEVPACDRERIIDGNPLSAIDVRGAPKAFLRLRLHSGYIEADHFTVTGRALLASVGDPHFKMVFEACRDGREWLVFSTIDGMFQDPSPGERTFRFSAELPTGQFCGVRVRFSSESVIKWEVSDFSFEKEGEAVSVLPSGSFTSVWRSAEGGPQTLDVDLGADSRIERVRLHWINQARKGSVLVSRDGVRWKKAASLPEDSGQLHDIRCQARGRYVRLDLEQSRGDAPYILSEMEVLGSGGLVPRPQPMPAPENGILRLQGGGWRLCRAGDVGKPGETVSSPGFDDRGWIPATVPGTVLTSYINIGAVPDGSRADDQVHISESFFQSDFWYRDTFDLPADFAGKTLTLRFDGINWKAEVFFNGTRLGEVAGAFRRGDFDVTALAQEHNVLAVKILKNAHPGAVTLQDHASAGLNGGILGADNPTFHASIGWDWIPTVRGRNIGIWNDVILQATPSAVTIEDADVASRLGPAAERPDDPYARSHADLTARAVLKNRSSSPVSGQLQVEFGGRTYAQPCTVPAGATAEVTLPAFRVENPRLWWPAGYGDPTLYETRFSFLTDGGASDSRTVRTGIREVTYSLDGGILDIYVNGRRFVGNGGSWGFPEFNLRFGAREYDAAVAYHADMGLTLIRNWVGQTGDEAFYEACDRHGVMVWQDFWLANPVDGPDPDDEALFLANARDYIRRIRRHPCLALYVGRNEGMPPAGLDKGLAALVNELHPGMLYIPHSAEGPVSGYGPYRALDTPAEYFALERGRDRLHSERGLPNVMTAESLLRWADEDTLWPKEESVLWGLHDFTTGGHQRGTTYDAILERWFGPAGSLKAYADLAQWVNYDLFRALYESRSPQRKGVLSWMSHSCWPSLVWHIYDYYFEPGAAYFGAKKACAPIRIQWNPVSGHVEVVNHSAGDKTGLQAVARILRFDGTVLDTQEARTDSPEDSTCELMMLPAPDSSQAAVYYIQLSLYEKDTLLADNFYWQSAMADGSLAALRSLDPVRLETAFRLTGPDGEPCTAPSGGEPAPVKTGAGPAPKPCPGHPGQEAVVTLKNPTSTPALMIRLRLQGSDGESILPVLYDDNFFALMPGEEKTVRIRFKQEDTRGLRPGVEISGFNVPAVSVTP